MMGEDSFTVDRTMRSSETHLDPEDREVKPSSGTGKLQRSADHQLSELSTLAASRPGNIEQRAAATIVRAIRKSASLRAQAHMLSNGEIWRAQTPPVESLEKSSSQNISRLRKELGQLSLEEQQFLDRICEQKFYATHFTGASVEKADANSPSGHVATLFSRRNLQAKGIAFPEINTEAYDAIDAGHDDYVFCSLECGEKNKKYKSRFGPIALRFELGSDQFKHAWISMNDMVAPSRDTLRKRFPTLPSKDSQIVNEAVQQYNKPEFIFSEKQMVPGLALAALHLTRKLSTAGREEILSASDDEALDKVINGLFRPEVKVPRFLVTSKYQKLGIEQLQKGFQAPSRDEIPAMIARSGSLSFDTLNAKLSKWANNEAAATPPVSEPASPIEGAPSETSD